ncbi:MAG TPA: FkbM family methyltransferase, partial [Paludibacteraceae bacterium]|nr:FkbM family methyltransferase [Paludibacteraceae bacterium]
KLKFPIIAVEPLPTDNLISKIEQYKINFLKGCIYSTNSQIDFYTGNFHNEQFYDVSSIYSNWWGVTDSSIKLKVPSYTFSYLIDYFKVKKITYLKLDTEGSEWEIIQQLNNNSTYELPAVIQFEYGGGGLKKENKDGWSAIYFKKTLNSLKHLKNLGYNKLLLFESSLNYLKIFNLKNVNNLEDIFSENFSYGDIVVSKKANYILLIILWLRIFYLNLIFRITKRKNRLFNKWEK